MSRARLAAPLALIACVLLGGCATGGAANDRAHVADHVQVDGATLTVTGNQTLLELLRNATFASRLAELAPLHDRPLVVVDGVLQVNGPATLASMPAVQVASVTTLRGVRAYALYGPAAERGAIVVRTRHAVGRH